MFHQSAWQDCMSARSDADVVGFSHRGMTTQAVLQPPPTPVPPPPHLFTSTLYSGLFCISMRYKIMGQNLILAIIYLLTGEFHLKVRLGIIHKTQSQNFFRSCNLRSLKKYFEILSFHWTFSQCLALHSLTSALDTQSYLKETWISKTCIWWLSLLHKCWRWWNESRCMSVQFEIQ